MQANNLVLEECKHRKQKNEDKIRSRVFFCSPPTNTYLFCKILYQQNISYISNRQQDLGCEHRYSHTHLDCIFCKIYLPNARYYKQEFSLSRSWFKSSNYILLTANFFIFTGFFKNVCISQFPTMPTEVDPPY